MKVSGTQLTVKPIFVLTIKVCCNDDNLNLGIKFSQSNGYIDPIQVLLRVQIKKATKYGSPNPEARSACSRASSTVVVLIIFRFLLLGCKLGYCWIIEQTAGYISSN